MHEDIKDSHLRLNAAGRQRAEDIGEMVSDAIEAVEAAVRAELDGLMAKLDDHVPAALREQVTHVFDPMLSSVRAHLVAVCTQARSAMSSRPENHDRALDRAQAGEAAVVAEGR